MIMMAKMIKRDDHDGQDDKKDDHDGQDDQN